MSKAHSLNDPLFNEFVFNCIQNATPEQRARIPFNLIKHFKNAQSAKVFADAASLEKKIELLARLGVGVSFWFAPPEHMTKDTLLDTFEAYQESGRLDAVRRMIQTNSFVFTDRSIAATLAVMGMLCHSETYRINREYARLSNSTIAASRVELNDAESIKGALEDFKLLVKLQLNTLMGRTYQDGLTSFSQTELSALMLLFLHRNQYLPLKDIQQYFAHLITPIAMTKVLYGLSRGLFVDKLPGRRPAYAITSSGMTVVANFLARTVNLTMGY